MSDLTKAEMDLINEADATLATAGVDVDAELKANDGAAAPVEVPVAASVTSVSKPEGFKSRSAARSYVKANGGRVVDNGTGAPVRWTVEAKAAKAVKRPAAVKVTKAPATAVKPGSKGDKKAVAIATYAELEASGTLKRSTFLAAMETKTGLSAKGASSYFYRIKGGKW